MEPLVIQIEDAETHTRARYAFMRSPVRIGRRVESDVALPSPFVSACHGMVQFDDRAAWYTDLGSRNGSLVDGMAVASAPVQLRPGAELRIGPVRLRFDRRSPGLRAAGDSTSGASASCPSSEAIGEVLERLARAPEPDLGTVWAASLHSGMVVGRFEILREIGRGGFGVVYEARDGQLGRRVALKVVKPGGGERARDGWLRREAEAAARLSHPNIVTLFDMCSWEGGPYLVLELLRGETLAERLRRGPLPLGQALPVAVDVARALAHAHAVGVLHRDLKPGNVFLTAEGFAKVLDFGLAQVLGPGARYDGGTPRYMAPEQRTRGSEDARTDVWSAGLLLHETLTCRVPGPGAALDLPGAPEPLLGLLGSALAERPEERPADGRAWLEALLRLERAVAPELWGAHPATESSPAVTSGRVTDLHDGRVHPGPSTEVERA